MKKHELQVEILRRFISSETGLRYRDGKPEDVDNDQYNYHLQQLVKEGLIEKGKLKYFLTEKGKKFVEDTFPVNPEGEVVDHFKVAALMIVVRKGKSGLQILYQNRKRHPNFDAKNIPGGPIIRGKSIEESAKLRLKQETGLEAEFMIKGVLRKIRKESEGELFGDMFFFICLADKFSGELENETSFGENYWIDIDEAIENEKNSDLGSELVVTILELLKTKPISKLPFLNKEEVYEIEKY